MTIIDIIKVEVFEFYFIACSVYNSLCSLFPRIWLQVVAEEMLMSKGEEGRRGRDSELIKHSSVFQYLRQRESLQVHLTRRGKSHVIIISHRSLLPPPEPHSAPASASRAIFSIKFIHLLIIAVNHSSCNDFYEFLFMHRAQSFGKSLFCRCRPYSSLLSIIISLTDTVVRKIGWLQAFLRLKK